MKKVAITSLLVLIFSSSCFSQMEIGFIRDNSNMTKTFENAKEDTIKALRHLYKRKKNGGTARAIVFGILGASSLVGTLSYQPSYVTINQGSAGSQRFETSSPPGAAAYFFIGFSTVMTITGITQATKYNNTNLENLITDYNQGKTLPQSVKIKLKRKDFR
jgi:hypothetical protein